MTGGGRWAGSLTPPFPPWRYMLSVDEVNYDLREMAAAARREPGREILNLASGVNFLPPPAGTVAYVVQAATDPAFWHDYDGPQGHLLGRAAIAACELTRGGGRLPLGPDNVLVTAGASAALSLAAHALAHAPHAAAGRGRPGAVLPVPTFPLVGACLTQAGFRVTQVASGAAAPAQPSVDDLIRAATPDTRLVYINTFNNPTGERYGAPELRRLVRWARTSGVVVLHDTVSSDVTAREPLPHLLSIAAEEGHLNGLVTVGSLSKTRALPGFRVGWLIAEEAFVRGLADANELGAPSSPAVATPALVLDRMATASAADPPAGRPPAAAWAILRSLVEPYLPALPGLPRVLEALHREMTAGDAVGEMLRWRAAAALVLADNIEVLTRDHGDLVTGAARWRGDFNTFVRVPGLDGLDQLDTTYRLFREYGLQTLPAPAFGHHPAWWRQHGYCTRLSFALPTPTWAEGLDRLRTAVGRLGRR